MTVGIRHAYKMFSKNNKSYSKQQYCKIVDDFLKFIMKKLYEGYEIKLPESFGVLQIIGRKTNPRINKETNQIEGLAPDWKKTYELWKNDTESKRKKEKIYFLNEHTQRIRYRFFWSKKHIFLKHKDLYSLRFSRTNKRYLAYLINNGKEYYVTI